MGFMDKLKGLFGGQKQQIDQGIDKAADAVKEKVPDEHVGKVDAVADKAHEAVEKLTDTTPADSAPPDSAPAAPAAPVAPVDSAPAAPAAPVDSAPAAPASPAAPSDSAAAAPADPEPAP